MSEENKITTEYTDDNIRHLSDMEHVRTRPGMYIGRLGDGSMPEDGIYVLLKEVIDNSIDEFKMNAGKRIEIDIDNNLSVMVRDYGRGIPQGKLIEAVSVLNTGGKYDSKAFKKSVGLNGVGIKAVNALSSRFEVRSYRDGTVRTATFERGVLKSDTTEETQDETGTYIYFVPDDTLFKNYSFHHDFVETMLRNYTYLNTGLTFIYNGQRIVSRHGLEDLLKDNMTSEGLYDIVHLKGEDIEIAFTHTNQYGEEYYSFVNGQHTTQGGTHQTALKEHIARTIKEFYNKNQDYADIRNGLVAAIAIDVEEPMFESQTKTKLGSNNMWPEGPTVNKYVGDFIKTEVDNYLQTNLGLNLNQKTAVIPIGNPVEFVGRKISPVKIELRRQTTLGMKKHLRYVQDAYAVGEIDLDYALSVITSYRGLFKDVTSDAFLEKMLDEFVLSRPALEA